MISIAHLSVFNVIVKLCQKKKEFILISTAHMLRNQVLLCDCETLPKIKEFILISIAHLSVFNVIVKLCQKSKNSY